MNVSKIALLKQMLSTPKNIVLVTHRNPDGDAMGSSLAMQHYLLSKGHRVSTVLPNEAPSFLQWLPMADSVLHFDKQHQQAVGVLLQADLVFLLDFNALHRVGEAMQKVLEAYRGTFVMIDHHQEPEVISDFVYSDTRICSTCQMVYQFIDMLGDLQAIDAPIATCLYTGILTDTGSFRFASTTAQTHEVVADLIHRGAENAAIHDRIFDNNTFSRMALMSTVLSNLVVLKEHHTAYMTLSADELERSQHQKGDTEGFVNLGLSVKGIHLAVIFIEDLEQGIVKISFRSKGNFSVNRFAREHFDGGGHDNAAGGKSERSLDLTVADFVKLLPKYQRALAQSHEF